MAVSRVIDCQERQASAGATAIPPPDPRAGWSSPSGGFHERGIDVRRWSAGAPVPTLPIHVELPCHRSIRSAECYVRFLSRRASDAATVAEHLRLSGEPPDVG